MIFSSTVWSSPSSHVSISSLPALYGMIEGGSVIRGTASVLPVRNARRGAFGALFDQGQQPDLDPLGQVRQLVDGEDAAVGARHQAVMDGQLVGEIFAL